MTFRPSLAIASLGFVAAVSMAACAADPGAPGDGLDEGESEVRASCTNPRRYFVFVSPEGDTRCEAIQGRHGEWVPEAQPVFADAPAEVQRATCVLTWVGDPWSRPDRDALTAKIGWQNAAAAACGSHAKPGIGLLEPIPYVENWTQGGAVGCDVCGITRGNDLWVVLPPERVGRHEVEVRLTNGTTKAFRIQGDASAMALELPAPPPGAAWVEGRARVY